MINEERIKLEAQMAIFEQGDGKAKLKAASYYKGDYIGLHQVFNLLGLTIGYLLMVLVAGVICYETILEGLTLQKLVRLGIGAVIVYAVLLLVYLILGRIFYGKFYKEAKADVREYYGKLNKLSRLYKDEKFESSDKSSEGENA